MNKFLESILYYFLFPLLALICYANIDILNKTQIPLGNTLVCFSFIFLLIAIFGGKIIKDKKKIK
jgi:predicted permease